MNAKKTIKLLRWLILAVLFIAVFAYTISFVVINSTTAQVNFIFFQIEDIAVELLVIACFIAGGITGLFSAAILLFLSYRKNKRLLRQYQQHMG